MSDPTRVQETNVDEQGRIRVSVANLPVAEERIGAFPGQTAMAATTSRMLSVYATVGGRFGVVPEGRITVPETASIRLNLDVQGYSKVALWVFAPGTGTETVVTYDLIHEIRYSGRAITVSQARGLPLRRGAAAVHTVEARGAFFGILLRTATGKPVDVVVQAKGIA